jgi:hypothetical protein
MHCDNVLKLTIWTGRVNDGRTISHLVDPLFGLGSSTVSALNAGLRGMVVPLDSEGVLIFTDKSKVDWSSLGTSNDYILEKKYNQECAGYDFEVSSRLKGSPNPHLY